MNKDNINKVIERIRNTPEDLNMAEFFSKDGHAVRPDIVGGCGTARCIAGEAIVCKAQDEGKTVAEVIILNGGMYSRMAREYLDLEVPIADSLFSGYFSSKPLDEITAEEAIAALETIRDTGSFPVYGA